MKSIQLYICEFNRKNLGDYLPMLLFPKFGLQPNEKTISQSHNPQMISIGTILSLPKTQPYTGIIWTSGLGGVLQLDLTKSKVYALRGKLTLKYCTLTNAQSDNLVLGDGGLLIDTLIEDKTPFLSRTTVRNRMLNDMKSLDNIDFTKFIVDRKLKIGIIPHYIDQKNAKQIIEERNDGWKTNLKWINICDPADKIMKEMNECDFIIASTLHGLITADALSIPNQWVFFNGSKRIGSKDFKYVDYYSVFDLQKDIQAVDITKSTSTNDIFKDWSTYERPGIDTVKENLKMSLEKMINEI